MSKRYAIITNVEVWEGENLIGKVRLDNGIGYKAELNDIFMSKGDVAFVGKVMEFMEENCDLELEEDV